MNHPLWNIVKISCELKKKLFINYTYILDIYKLLMYNTLSG